VVCVSRYDVFENLDTVHLIVQRLMNSEPPSFNTKSLLVSLLGTIFALSAMGICIHGHFYSTDTAIKTQAIYWFGISMAAAFIPQLKGLATYIRRVKVGDVEIELNELKKELSTVKNKMLKMDQRLLSSLEQVREKEASLSGPMKHLRGTVYDDFASKMSDLPADVRLAHQKSNTLSHLADAKIGVSQLKEMLRILEYFQGSTDDTFTEELAESIAHFQRDHLRNKPDGIAGSITLNAIHAALTDGRLHQG